MDTPEIPDEISALAVRLAGGWQPTLPSFADVAQVSWGNRDLSTERPRLSLNDDKSITLTCSTSRRSEWDQAWNSSQHSEMPGLPLEARLADGTIVHAREAFLVGIDSRFSQRGDEVAARLKIFD